MLLVTSPHSPRRRAGRAARRSARWSVGLPLATLLAATVTGCTDSPEPAPEPDTALTTPLVGYDTSAAGVQRTAFCDLLDGAAIEEALGEFDAVEEWRDGDRLREVGDIVQEYGCRWEGESATGSGWVLAPPVTTRQAERLLEAEPARGCRAVPDAPAYGEPSRTLSCDGGSRVRFAGLFGDAWLTCEISGARGQEDEVTRDLAGRWCVAVAQAAAS